MNVHDFLNIGKAIDFVDPRDFAESHCGASYVDFMRDPFRYMSKLSDDDLGAVWSLIAHEEKASDVETRIADLEKRLEKAEKVTGSIAGYVVSTDNKKIRTCIPITYATSSSIVYDTPEDAMHGRNPRKGT